MSLDFIRKSAKYVVTLGVAATIAITSLIKPWEGVRYTPYRDVGGVLTVCYGHTGPDVTPEKRYTQEECNKLLEYDVSRFDAAISKHVKVDISDEMRAALISFMFNVGEENFRRSTLLRKLNDGNPIAACNELTKWVYVKGVKYQGLENRRKAERAMCLKNVRIPI